MIYSGTLLKINGIAIPYLKEYKVLRAKLWKDAERNMEGEIRATFIGLFPKLILRMNYMDEDQLAALTQLLDKSQFSVEYFDVRTQGIHTADYYASDYTVGLLDKSRGLYEPFEVSLVPISARRYT